MKTGIKEFYEKIKQHCIKNEMKCHQCCFRIFCYMSPSEITVGVINEVESYLNMDKQEKYIYGGEIEMNLKNITTKDLLEELEKRDGVEMVIAEPYKDEQVKVNGPAIICIITD